MPADLKLNETRGGHRHRSGAGVCRADGRARGRAPVSADPRVACDHHVPRCWRDAKLGIFIHWGVYSVPAFAPPGAATTAAPPNCTGYAEWYWFVQQLWACTAYRHHILIYGPRCL